MSGPHATAPGAARRASPSLRARVLRHVMLPLALTWLAGTVVTFMVASYFTQQAFDRALLDDAYSIASNVRLNPDGEVALQLTPRELTAALFDRAEKVYFSVVRPDDRPLAGTPMPAVPPAPGEAFHFSEFSFDGHDVRAVTLRHQVQDRPGDYRVVVAHTTVTRGVLAGRVLVFATLPQVLRVKLAAY